MERSANDYDSFYPDSDRSEVSHPNRLPANIRQKAPNGQPISGCGRFVGMLNRGYEWAKERP
jgi:hypothetical protein